MSNNEANAYPQYDVPPKYDMPPQQQVPQMQQPVMTQQPMMMNPQPMQMYNPGYNLSPTVINPTQVTVNVMQQQEQYQNPRTWSTTLCGCFEDILSCCCVTFFCPCYTCCNISPQLGESCCAPLCLTSCGYSVPMVYRTKVRAAHGILGGAIDDCTTVMFCTPCVMCQIKRELDFIERATGKPAFR